MTNEEAIETLRKIALYVPTGVIDPSNFYLALDLAIKALERSEQGEWTPVSEGLPEEKLFNPSGSDFGFDFDEVLCTTIWGNVRPYKYGKPIGHDKAHFGLVEE